MSSSAFDVALLVCLTRFFVITDGLVYQYGTRTEDLIPPATSWYSFWLQGPTDHVVLYVQPSPVHVPDSVPRQTPGRPDVWPLDYPACSGVRQSPINLESDDMYRLVVPQQLRWQGYWARPRNLTLTNNGHTIQVAGSWGGPEYLPYISGGPLDSDYMFSQLHFHWGSNDRIGSEHTVSNVSFPMELHLVHYKKEYGSQDEALKYEDGLAVVSFLFQESEDKYFPMELHLVHYKKEYGSQDEALKYEDGLAVVSFLFQLSDRPNPALNAIIPFLDAVVGAELEITLMHPFPLEMLDLSFANEYVTYLGSLTTPPCSEVVTWIVSSRSLTISEEQLNKFRQLSTSDGEMKNNFRPVQPTNGRPVFYVS
ncbi:hypothetical protein C0J52_04811 [Blattella germanica]|nr:hypothetical protein C0J52_04811 [Blattella germanica]